MLYKERITRNRKIFSKPCSVQMSHRSLKPTGINLSTDFMLFLGKTLTQMFRILTKYRQITKYCSTLNTVKISWLGLIKGKMTFAPIFPFKSQFSIANYKKKKKDSALKIAAEMNYKSL